MSIKFYVTKRIVPLNGSTHHIALHDTGRTYKGLGVKDLQRRLKYWTQRVGQVASLTASAEGKAKKDADKLLKSGEKLIKTLSKQIEERRAA